MLRFIFLGCGYRSIPVTVTSFSRPYPIIEIKIGDTRRHAMLFERDLAAASAFIGPISSSAYPNFSASELRRRVASNAIENDRLTDAGRNHGSSISDGKWDTGLTMVLIGYRRSPVASRAVFNLCFCEVIYCGCLHYSWGLQLQHVRVPGTDCVPCWGRMLIGFVRRSVVSPGAYGRCTSTRMGITELS